MNRGPGSRPLLPQTNSNPNPIQSFNFAAPNLGLGDTKKNYVFVDEHNRHKRLKVMRACEGCRRRKIKCDSATTNQWPCAACVRLKLPCVPPTVNYNRTHSTGSHVSGLERVLDFDNSGSSGDEEYSQPPMVQNVSYMTSTPELMGPTHISHESYTSSLGSSYPPSYTDGSENQPHLYHESVTSVPTLPVSEASYHSQTSFHPPSVHPTVQIPESGDDWPQASREDLSEYLGDLKISETGVAPYIFQQKKTLAEAPALDEYEMSLPSVSFGSGATVRIPPELMPSEETALAYFDVFFTQIHPYVPVISKSYFYQQWHTNKKSISPLLLEAIFACAGRMMPDDPSQGAQWLSMASKHEDCFMDVPRLSTIQALLILMKARESAPKRGYYYRSWMNLQKLISMAKDLELHEHFVDHQEGRPCGSDPTECIVKTRIWQTMYMCEMMIAGPQGRFDLNVATETVDFSVEGAPAGADESEYRVSQNFTYMVRTVRNVRALSDEYAKIKKQENWGSNPSIANLNASFSNWEKELPHDMQIHYPPDGSPPWLPSHFVGNMHCYYHLSIILLHRPQLMKSTSFAAGGSWKQHMALCYIAAKSLCRIQEALLQTYDMDGLLSMQRGINFTIYCILSCTSLHLVAMTSPDPDFNTDARDYFQRHMRILENCTHAWPMPDMQKQIESLREAFSKDINKPFELKPSFPYGSPTSRLQPSPPLESRYSDQNLRSQTTHETQPPHLQYHSMPITPPISTGHNDDIKDGSIAAPSLTMMATGQRQQQQQQQQQQMQLPSSHLVDENLTWNPTRIFEYGAKSPTVKSKMVRPMLTPRRSQWNTAFGTPSSTMSVPAGSMSQQSPTMYTPPPISHQDLPHLHDAMQQHAQFQLPSNMPPLPQIQPPLPTSYASTGHHFVSPSMWQETVASTYDPHGLKRRWDTGGSSYDQQQVKRPR